MTTYDEGCNACEKKKRTRKKRAPLSLKLSGSGRGGGASQKKVLRVDCFEGQRRTPSGFKREGRGGLRQKAAMFKASVKVKARKFKRGGK